MSGKKVEEQKMLTKITYYQIFGVSLIIYLGILAFLLFTATALVAIRNKRGGRLPFKWHHSLATISIIVAFTHGILGLLGGDTIGFGITGSGQERESHKPSSMSAGADIFNAHCRSCHPNGGNIIDPDKPIKGSQKLKDFETFFTFLRNPTSPMPSFSQRTISDKQARELYIYITSEKGMNLMKLEGL
jgi:hypothetical protein